MVDVLDRLNDPQNDTPPCSVNRSGHSPEWFDRGETCAYCDLPGSCPHTADPSYTGRWCGICDPARHMRLLGGRSMETSRAASRAVTSSSEKKDG